LAAVAVEGGATRYDIPVRITIPDKSATMVLLVDRRNIRSGTTTIHDLDKRALGDLLRSSIDHTAHQEITLGEELGFVRRYVDIQQARFRNRLEVQIDVADDALGALVPSFVLQPLVENAIRHGIEPHTRGGTIWICASRRDQTLVLTVRDDGAANEPVYVARGADGRSAVGVRLANIEARLGQLYGAAQTFRAGKSNDGCFSVELTLPFHTDAGLFPAESAPT
jgi:LytS/YehU family sensor histidine kinase